MGVTWVSPRVEGGGAFVLLLPRLSEIIFITPRNGVPSSTWRGNRPIPQTTQWAWFNSQISSVEKTPGKGPKRELEGDRNGPLERAATLQVQVTRALSRAGPGHTPEGERVLRLRGAKAVSHGIDRRVHGVHVHGNARAGVGRRAPTQRAQQRAGGRRRRGRRRRAHACIPWRNSRRRPQRRDRRAGQAAHEARPRDTKPPCPTHSRRRPREPS